MAALAIGAVGVARIQPPTPVPAQTPMTHRPANTAEFLGAYTVARPTAGRPARIRFTDTRPRSERLEVYA